MTKDRIALISFQKNGFWQKLPLVSLINRVKYTKWKHAKMEILKKLNDLDSKCDEYPKVKLEMVQKITYFYDKSEDPEGVLGLTFQFEKSSKF